MILTSLVILAGLGAFGYLAYTKGLNAAVAGVVAVASAVAVYALDVVHQVQGLFV